MENIDAFLLIEESIQATEQLLDVSITIIDKHGLLRTRTGAPLLGQTRQSHGKNRICQFGFCQKCIDHCRHQVAAQGEANPSPFLTHCWKGLQEVAVPLVWNKMHVGTLFAGIWRHPQATTPPANIRRSAAFRNAWNALPLVKPQTAAHLMRFLPVWAQGILSLLESTVFFEEHPHSRKEAIARFLHYRSAHAVALADLADELHLTPSRTSHLVKELFGQSFQSLVQHERLQMAKVLLQTTDHPIADIARQTGFCDVYYFSRLFKTRCGMPPSAYRKQKTEAM